MSQRPSVSIYEKFTWGRTTLVASFAALALLAPVEAFNTFAEAGPKGAAQTAKVRKPAKARHLKMDGTLNERADGNGESDVIVLCKTSVDCLPSIKAAGGKGGRRLGIINGRAGRMPDALLKRLADDPNVAYLGDDRETWDEVARTAAAIGAKNVHAQYGYTGAGVGVAVIDSGITPWHDDLTIAKSRANASPLSSTS